MDISELIRNSIAALPDGEYVPRLSAVANQIDVAIAHLNNGRISGQTHLFTDAVYRCNQAYEGSIKEAYRVLTGNDPSKKKTFEIEKYLEDKNVLRPRVLEQLRRYRQEWRNPATHDHTEEFDEGEAFLAIVNIVAFAKVCIDQIAQAIAFESAQKANAKSKKKPEKEADLADVISFFAEQFFEQEIMNLRTGPSALSESEISAALAGFLSAVPGAEVEVESIIGGSNRHRVDLAMSYRGEFAIVELKSIKASNSLGTSLIHIDMYLEIEPRAHGIIVLYDVDARKYATYDIGSSFADKRRLLVAPPQAFFDKLFKKLS